MIKTKVLIVGATALGVSLSERLDEDVLIIDEGINAGNEFADALGGEKCRTGVLSEETTELLEEMTSRNIINREGEIHLLPISNILAKGILEKNIKILLTTNIISIQEKENGFKVEVVTHDGIEEIYAEKIVNTTMNERVIQDGYDKEIVAFLIESESVVEQENEEYRIVKSRFSNESYLFVNADDCKNIMQAREKLHKFWKNNRKEFGESIIANIGSRFFYRFEKVVTLEENGIIYAPSVSYGNILAAFEGGKNVLQLLKKQSVCQGKSGKHFVP